jgi:hypothetical protein
MTWENVLKREFKIFDGNPPAFMVSLMSSQKNRDRLKGKEIKIYGDDNYIDMVNFNEISISDFLRSEQMMGLLEMDNIVVVADSKGTFN